MVSNPMRPAILLAILLVGLLRPVLYADDGFNDIQSHIVEHTLKNGMKFLFLPRRDMPVISFHTYVDVGSANDDRGTTGLAHIFEHMAFKGTRSIGATDYEKEKAAMANVDRAYLALRAERLKADNADPARLKALEEAFNAAQEEASQFVVNNEFPIIIEQAGGVGLNASTGTDATEYMYSLPSNKLELWMYLESSRFLEPVLRDFYRERDVVKEERRRSVDSQPIGRLLENLVAATYKAHPYKEPTVGHMSDLDNVTREQAEAFYRKHYTPNNMVVAVVGDLTPQDGIRLAEKYFERLPARPKPDPIWTIEPPRFGESTLTLQDNSQRVFVIAYHKPALTHKDNAVFDALTDILGAGRTSRLYRSLVRDKQLASDAGAFPGLPGQKYPNLFVFYALAAPGHTNDEMAKAMDEEIERIRRQPVDDATLARVKNRAKVQFIRSLNSNAGLAARLTMYQMLTGDWRNLFKTLDQINAVTAADIQRVAAEYFKRDNRTVGRIEPLAQK